MTSSGAAATLALLPSLASLTTMDSDANHLWVPWEARESDTPVTSDPTPKSDGNHFFKCKQALSDHDKQIVNEWEESIGTHLVVVRSNST